MQHAAERFSRIRMIEWSLCLAAALLLPVSGCTMNETQQRVGSGAAIGAVAGGLLGGRRGAAIGAAIGGSGGYIVDQQKKRENTDAENERLREENYRLQQQLEQQQ